MRFEIRFGNGYWKLFDTERYMDVALFDTLRAAHAECARVNESPRAS